MKVILAGYNLDYETIKEMKAEHPDAGYFTPETISAAYARISRNPAPVDQLREIARKEVEKARKSNQTIVFDMGHSSVAEHAVFNVDILGVSRLLVEELEKFRLCSYTEKSQRYVLLGDDFVIPAEIRQAGLEDLFTTTVRRQNAFYHILYEALLPYIFDTHKHLAENSKTRAMLDGWAKEDARYVIPLATETQLGMTLNARNLELMLRRCAAHPLDEANRYGRELYEITKNVAPSLVRYTEATEFDQLTRAALKEKSKEILDKGKKKEERPAERRKLLKRDNVVLVYGTADGDDRIVAALLHASSGAAMERCLAAVSRMKTTEKKELIRTACRSMKPYDAVLREFENADLQFEITVSASCFAQLKRHRLATILSQEYDPALGVTVPPAVSAIGMKAAFLEIIARTEETYEKIRRICPLAAPYILTNAHRKRVSVKMNVRELYHISRLRADSHAQWDIRYTSERMLDLGRKVMPISLMLAAGKDQFASTYERCFNRP